MLNVSTTITRLIFAFIFGGVIGWERERKHGAAGLRTHILVCMGSTLTMLVSLYTFEIYKGMASIDPGRIAAGVVTGIGFIGAGAIIRNPEKVLGLTTAASIWVSAAIGLAIGCGYISAALVTTVLSFIVLSMLKKIEQLEQKHSKSKP